MTDEIAGEALSARRSTSTPGATPWAALRLIAAACALLLGSPVALAEPGPGLVEAEEIESGSPGLSLRARGAASARWLVIVLPSARGARALREMAATLPFDQELAGHSDRAPSPAAVAGMSRSAGGPSAEYRFRLDPIAAEFDEDWLGCIGPGWTDAQRRSCELIVEVQAAGGHVSRYPLQRSR